MSVFFKLKCHRYLFLLPAFMVYSTFPALSQDSIEITESVEDSVIVPDAGELNTVDGQDAPVIDMQAQAETPSISAPSALNQEIGSDSFFDADDLVPQGEMSAQGPVKVNPVTQPASKLVTVTRGAPANSKTAQYIAAERAVALGRYDSALKILDSLYEKNPKDVSVLMARATTLQKLKRFEEAMQMYERISELQPDNIDAKINMLGLLGTRFPSIALRQLIELHKQHENNVDIMAQLAVSYARAGDSESALSYLGAAASIDERNANHLYNMAVISDRAGDKTSAVKYYEKALEIDSVYGGGRTIPRDAVYSRLAQIR